MLDEMLLTFCQGVPILVVRRQVDLLRCPERGLMLLVHLEKRGVLDGEKDPPLRILFQERVGLLQLAKGRRDRAHRRLRNQTHAGRRCTKRANLTAQEKARSKKGNIEVVETCGG